MSQKAFEQALDFINIANSEDPNTVTDAEGKEWPKELLYSHHMSDMLERFAPETDDVIFNAGNPHAAITPWTEKAITSGAPRFIAFTPTPSPT